MALKLTERDEVDVVMPSLHQFVCSSPWQRAISTPIAALLGGRLASKRQLLLLSSSSNALVFFLPAIGISSQVKQVLGNRQNSWLFLSGRRREQHKYGGHDNDISRMSTWHKNYVQIDKRQRDPFTWISRDQIRSFWLDEAQDGALWLEDSALVWVSDNLESE